MIRDQILAGALGFRERPDSRRAVWVQADSRHAVWVQIDSRHAVWFQADSRRADGLGGNWRAEMGTSRCAAWGDRARQPWFCCIMGNLGQPACCFPKEMGAKQRLTEKPWDMRKFKQYANFWARDEGLTLNYKQQEIQAKGKMVCASTITRRNPRGKSFRPVSKPDIQAKTSLVRSGEHLAGKTIF